MDQDANQNVEQVSPGAAGPGVSPAADSPKPGRISRRRLLQCGVCGVAGLGAAYCLMRSRASSPSPVPGVQPEATETTAVFRGDAPQGPLWENWQKRGWVKEARHYLKLGRNVQCKLCPNECLLEPEDRSHCRNKVNKDGTLYTLAYGNASAFHWDPIEKKPLFHFLPGTQIFSFATSGCGFRCLNCQNWDISQRKPEEVKDPRGESARLNPQNVLGMSLTDFNRLSMFPEDVVAMAGAQDSPSIAYTYSEPTAWYEYMIDTAALARQKKIRNVWVTCGYVNSKPLVELCRVIDAASINLKSYSDEIYRKLNSGRLQPILDTLQTLKREGVWFEVINLIVPTYTDKPEMIRHMCQWLVDHIGPDYPLHFSRFHPAHKLMNLPPTPVDVLIEARSIARECGLRYVYVGNVRDVPGAETTYCPHCKAPVIEREMFSISAMNLDAGRCKACKTPIAGVWS